MVDTVRCIACAKPLDGRATRLFEHLASAPLVPTRSLDDPLCVTCADGTEKTLTVHCDDCAALRLAAAVVITDADIARGWALADRDQVAAFRGEPLHPLAQVRPGRFAKLSFVTTPMRAPRPIESM